RSAARDPADRRDGGRSGALLHGAPRAEGAQPRTPQAGSAYDRQQHLAQGLDVVVEGTAVRVTDHDALQRLADAFEAKYGSVWHFDVGNGGFGTREDAAPVLSNPPRCWPSPRNRTPRPSTG